MVAQPIFVLTWLSHIAAACAGPRLEDEAWRTSNITLFQSNNADKAPQSWFYFLFSNVNTNLELSTWCVQEVAATDSIFSTSYTPCQNETVAFYYDGSTFKLQRKFLVDTCVFPGDTCMCYHTD